MPTQSIGGATNRESVAVLKAYGERVELECDLDDHISKTLLQGEFYERDLLEDVYKKAPVGVAVDVGAHIGNHSLWFSVVCGLEVYAFEPNDENYRRLSTNVLRNQAKVRPLKFAVGHKRGRANIKPPRIGNSGTSEALEAEHGKIPLVPLDALQLRNVALLKIDVEGSELGVLWGAHELIARDRPLIYVESTENRNQIARYLAAYGYWNFGRFAKTPTWGFRAA